MKKELMQSVKQIVSDSKQKKQPIVESIDDETNIVVKDYGNMKVGFAKQRVVSHLTRMIQLVNSDAYNTVDQWLGSSNNRVIANFVDALKDAKMGKNLGE